MKITKVTGGRHSRLRFSRPYLQLIPEFPKSPPDTDKPGGKSSAPDANPPLNAAKKHEALDGESMKTRQIF